MGNTRSLPSEVEEEEDVWWSNKPVIVKNSEPKTMEPERQKRVKEELDEFKLELARKHERRRQLIAEKQKELQELRDEVKRLTVENEELKQRKSETNELAAIEDIRRKNLELKMTIAKLQKDLQELNGEVANFDKERQDYKAHVVALKDVVSVSKQMILIREGQLNELREKIKEIEASLAGRELKVLSQDLRAEYEKQLQNIKNLRVFYEERQRADRKEKEEMRKFLDELKKELVKEKNKNVELSENLERLEEENSKKYDEIMSLESNLGLTRAECRQYQAELSVINQLFAQILLGFNNNQEMDIDKLIKLLEENHHLLQDIAVNEGSNQVSALPKVLLDLVNEVNTDRNGEEEPKQNKEVVESQNSHQLNSVSEIVENLPKVWKVLIELLSHQSAPVSNEDKNENHCYKVVETPKGPHLVLSISKTFIRLKDLILEKKSLERETGRLKHLNTHLEGRLQEQEKRLEMVTKELSETWHVVGKLQKKHQLLHTQEKILRYELAQKRKLLTELKEELEYSREKWQEAREKNSNTEKQWEQLRIEFASRKNAVGDDYNNSSVESGYSDDKECTSEDEPGYESDMSDSNRKSEDEQKTAGDEEQTNRKAEPKIEEVAEQKTVEEISANRRIEEVVGASSASNLGDITEQKTVDEVSTANRKLEQTVDVPSTSDSGDVTEQKTDDEVVPDRPVEQKTIDEVLSAREQRLLRLEDMCKGLVKQVTDTSSRSEAISSRLDALHSTYGEGSGDSSEPK